MDLGAYHEWFVLVHIVSAIVAVGANVTYVAWLSIVERDREHLPFAIGGIQRLDQRLTGPAYLVLLVSGILLILAEDWSIAEPWLFGGIVLYLVSGGVSFLGLTPALRAQLAAGQERPDGPTYAAAARRSRLMAWLIVAIVSVVVVLMVLKPTV